MLLLLLDGSAFLDKVTDEMPMMTARSYQLLGVHVSHRRRFGIVGLSGHMPSKLA